MLMAENQSAQLIAATAADRKSVYRCPGCQAPVRLKRGTVMSAHFAHKANQACETFSEGETAEHILGKQQLAAWFAAAGYTVQLEARLPAIHQRPDVLVQLGNHQPLALEFQCSPIAVEKLTQRTKGYREHGYRVLWLLGSPYQHQLRANAKALKFLQHHHAWGCFLIYWCTNANGGQLLLNLTVVDGERLNYQRQRWAAKQVSVPELLTYQPNFPPPIRVPVQFEHYQHRLILGRLQRQPAMVTLQTYCYRHGGTLAQLPLWVFMMAPKVPILKTTYLAWYLHIFVTLRQGPATRTPAQLLAIIWRTLTPCLAQRPCLLASDELQAQLIAAVVTELAAAKVIRRVAGVWQLQAGQLAWSKH
ncbi:competence protein CoiA family protein [Lactiplantibacillus sp. WILCCON 0030]|uniref:Competence protein CoiA family protein n=1 Tax=Lactiplantibacillus brownii TaxID=3069269 RepID=A0ABU1A9K4_9LACO|nr:competence protein CoiA family protein [Lactiplantibacillus brownii]MDQ7937656.1 competence protein CoiA family protein [Lactiplantibacillus brownii]